MTWAQTFSDRAFDLLDPKPSQVCASDLAHSLGFTCRYNGHSRRHWSTAQHSIIVAAAVWHLTGDPFATGHGLLHDGHEAYTGDIIHPMKAALFHESEAAARALRTIENRCDRVIWTWAGLPSITDKIHGIIKRIDGGAELALERSLLFGKAPRPWWIDEEGIVPLSPADVGDRHGGPIWNVLTASWSNEEAEAAFHMAMRRCLPNAPHGHPVDPPPWLATALRLCLPSPRPTA